MSGDLHELLSHDHERLDGLLARALSGDVVDLQSYEEFRRGLLRHIGIEEKILFPEIRRRRGAWPVEQQLHRDHAVLAALLVPPPTAAEIETIRQILLQHNPLEEDAGGLYEMAEQLVGVDLTEIVARVRAFPEVSLAPHADTPVVRRAIKQLLREAAEGRRQLLGDS